MSFLPSVKSCLGEVHERIIFFGQLSGSHQVERREEKKRYITYSTRAAEIEAEVHRMKNAKILSIRELFCHFSPMKLLHFTLHCTVDSFLKQCLRLEATQDMTPHIICNILMINIQYQLVKARDMIQ